MARTLSLFIVLLLPLVAWAEMAPLRSHKKVMGRGKYLLVMLYSKANGPDAANELNDLYPQSGLYPNDNSRKPIWMLPMGFEGEVFLSRNGEYLANIVYPAECTGDGVQFYHKGQRIRSYKITELAHKSAIKEACPSCIWHGLTTFDEAAETIAVEVNDGRTWTFDLRSGNASVRRGEHANVDDASANVGVVLAIALLSGFFGIATIAGLIGGYWYLARKRATTKSE
ncbi:MAG: hypothetical protein EXS16_00240 [Gemmataceae bacterium]|nr:hypothetical protein [Gemmataceae bacterium]